MFPASASFFRGAHSAARAGWLGLPRAGRGSAAAATVALLAAAGCGCGYSSSADGAAASEPASRHAGAGGSNENDKSAPRIVIVGGGTAGVGVAAMCEREGLKSVTVIEPSPIHYYQPLWTLVGGGVKSNAASARPMEDVIPKSAQWIQAAATAFDPDNNRVVLEGGRELEYDYLVVAAGIRSDWDAVPGVREGLDRPESGVVSVYDYSYSAKVWSEYNRIKDWDRKTLVFTMPPTPIKCAGAPQKIMWLLEDRLRRANQRDTASVEFWVPGPAMFSVPYYSAKLEKLREERGVAARFRHELVSLDVDRRVATFRDLGGGGGGSRLVEKRYDLIHVVPHMGPPDAIKNSPLAEASPPGYMDVDPATLRSARYRNVFGLGDCTNTPNSKTAAAVTRQAPVVVHNLGRVIRGLEPDGAYDGYASCPLVTGIGRCLLAEFGYGGKIMETFGRRTGPFPLNLVGTDGPLQQRFFYFLKEKVFPFVYWNLWTRGYWYGTRGPFRPNVVPNPDPKADGKDAAK